MAIDMATLKATTYGDPEAKLSVKRSWLAEVYRLLEEGATAKRELAALRASVKKHNDMVKAEAGFGDMDKGFEQMDEGMGKIFGEGGAFDTIFGKRRRKG